MARRKGKKDVKLTEEENKEESQREDKKKEDEEAERQIGAIRAIRDVEIEQSLNAMRLLCSYFDEDQLQTPVLEFFKQHLPADSFVDDTDVRATLFGTDNTHLHNLVNGQRLSFGMTPKTRRLPKPGEMLLSVHGSPLGFYEENQNMVAINEENC